MNLANVLLTTDLSDFALGMDFLISSFISTYIFAEYIRDRIPKWAVSSTVWVAWWSACNAVTIVVDILLDGVHPLSYGNIGVVCEAAINVGVILLLIERAANDAKSKAE